MAVQRQAGFETQAVAGTQADRLYAGVLENGSPDAFGVGVRHGNLIAVLAGVAGAGDEAVDAEQHQSGAVHEAELGQHRLMRGHDFGGLGPLDGDQGAVGQHGQFRIAGQIGLEEGEVGVLVAGVDDDIEAVVVGATGHQVVQDSTLGVQQQAVFLATGFQDRIVAGHETLELRRGVVTRDPALTHVRDVEQAGVFAGPAMLGQHALILHRHVIAAEADHAGTQRAVSGIERRGLEGVVGHVQASTVASLGRKAPPSSRPRCPEA